MTGDEFLNVMADQLAHDLTANDRIRQLTRNSALIGAYAEATVRKLVSTVVSPLRVSTGGIIYEGNCPDGVKQLDTIIWFPCPVPALFEVGEFALVPRGSAMGYLEIKRSNYNNQIGAVIKEALDGADTLLPPGKPVLAAGVICLRDHGIPDKQLDKLVATGRVMILLERDDKGDIIARPKDLFTLINFLNAVRQRAKDWDGQSHVNTSVIVQKVSGGD